MKRSNNKYTEKVKHYNEYLNLLLEVNQLERLISMNNIRTTSSNNNKKKKSSSSLHFFESPKKQNAVNNRLKLEFSKKLSKNISLEEDISNFRRNILRATIIN